MKNNDKPIETFVFFTGGTGVLSRLIKFVTKSAWSHCGIGFVFEHKTVYFEALYKKGVRGPSLFADVEGWVRRDSKRLMLRIPLSLNKDATEKKYQLSEKFVGKVGYYALQLFLMWAFERFGIRVPSSRDRMVCSEFVARVLFPDINVTNYGRSFDEITPEYLYNFVRREEGYDVPLGI